MLTIARVRPADRERYAAVRRLLGAAEESALAGLVSAEVWLLLAEAEGAPAGALTAVVVPKLDARRGFLFIDELVVAPGQRRQGVATALLARAEALAQAAGLAGVRLLVRPENAAARRLYARAGYRASPTLFCEKTFSA